MFKKSILVVLLAMMLSIPAFAADYSGNYSLQQGDATLVVDHSGNSLTFTHTRTDRTGQQRVTTFTYVTDGTERSVANLRGENRNISATWQNDTTLVVESSRNGRTMIETWVLDGDTLTLELAPQNSDRPRVANRTVIFQR